MGIERKKVSDNTEIGAEDDSDMDSITDDKLIKINSGIIVEEMAYSIKSIYLQYPSYLGSSLNSL